MQTVRRTMKLASRGKRFAAAVIDIVPVAIIMLIVSIYIGYLIAASIGPYYGISGGFAENGFLSGAVAFILGLLIIVYCGIQLYFFARSQSIGKFALGLLVVDNRTGDPAGFWRVLLRELFGKQASSAPCALGLIWILIDKYNRGWHDKIFDTYVVDIRESALYAAQSQQSEAAAQAAPVSAPVSAAEPAAKDPSGSQGVSIAENAATDGISDWAYRETEGSIVDVKPTDDPIVNPVVYTRTAAEAAAARESVLPADQTEDIIDTIPEETEQKKAAQEETWNSQEVDSADQ